MGHEDDKVSRPPTLTGIHGRAWKIDVSTYEPTFPACKGLWMVEVPWAHPFWHSYILCLIDLVPRETDEKPPHLYFPEATHEFMVMAMDPKQAREQAFERIMGLCLFPPNFGAQMVSDDAQASARMEATVKEMINGDLSPDTDFFREWVKRFGDSMVKDNYKEKKH